MPPSSLTPVLLPQKHKLKGGKKEGTIIFGVGPDNVLAKVKLPDKGVCLQVDAPRINDAEGYRLSVRTSLHKRASGEKEEGVSAASPLPALAE